ncbi:hypothetical protein B0E42_20405 [Pseudomonas sp. A25(2017)]|uniref:hypothetical protein n=1 Tax=Pseudomonas sp. A25(2017) TaxID=1945865 RepID=UPI000985F74C|nr:hypothetical protein [Pseudomonas sp. A25(2017)]OOG83200.1 hypothetical protein B0E42_20405 [Pseudomonas sp. A25(2017)]
MKITLDLSEHQLDLLRQFREQHALNRRTPASAPMLELQRVYSSLSTTAIILAEAVDQAAKDQGI